MLISANLENGGCGAINEGTNFAMPMGATATGDMVNGYRLGKISCQEAAAVGVNLGFAPLGAIGNNYRYPITLSLIPICRCRRPTLCSSRRTT